MISEIAVYFKKGGNIDVDIGDINKLKKVVTEQFKDGLPVLHAKARASQEIIAENIGVSHQTYNAIEIGKRDISCTTFLAAKAGLVFMEIKKNGAKI